MCISKKKAFFPPLSIVSVLEHIHSLERKLCHSEPVSVPVVHKISPCCFAWLICNWMLSACCNEFHMVVSEEGVYGVSGDTLM